jgi:hypothetical protein
MIGWLLEQNHMGPAVYFSRPDILWIHVVSDAVIALACFTVLIVLLSRADRRRDMPWRGLLTLIGAFLTLAGVTHVLSIITLWNPLPALDGVIKLAAAMVAAMTAAMLVVRFARIGPSVAELEQANAFIRGEIDRRRMPDRRMAHIRGS